MKPNAPIGHFEKFISSAVPPYPPVLPLVHVTHSIWADKILKSGIIEATPCKEFSNEPLAYFFYGAARYRGSPKPASTLSAWLPFAFVIKLDRTKVNIKRAYPFDTGAFKQNKYADFFHPAMPLNDFLLTEGDISAQKCVQTFFGDNKGYLSESTRADLKYPPSNFHINSYVELISNGKPDEVDHRRSAIEFQIGSDVKLQQHEVISVVVPERLMDDLDFVNLVRKVCKVEPVSYKNSKAPSDFHYGQLFEVVDQMISKKS